MTTTEKLFALATCILSGVAVAYIHKCKTIERLNDAQTETIAELREYIEWTESDHSKVYTRRCTE